MISCQLPSPVSFLSNMYSANLFYRICNLCIILDADVHWCRSPAPCVEELDSTSVQKLSQYMGHSWERLSFFIPAANPT